MTSSKKKNNIPRSPWRIITLSAFAVILILVMLLSHIYVTGGDRPTDDMDSSEVNDAVWGKTLDYTFASENVSTVSAEDDLMTLTNGRLTMEVDRSSPYLSKVYGSESSRLLFLTVPTVKMGVGGREYSIADSVWSVPMNGPYNAAVSFDAALSALGTEDDFVSIKKYTFTEKSDVTSWSMILKDCSLALSEDTAKVTVSSSDHPYFGSGKLDIDLAAIPDGASGCVRLRVKGFGLTGVEVNYSAVYETMRLQGVAVADTDISDEWKYIVIPVTDGNFVGELYTLYFRLTAEEDAEFYVDSVEVGYIAPHVSSVDVNSTCTVYSDRYLLSSALSSDVGFTADEVWTECVIPAEELLHVEAVTGENSEYYGVEDFTVYGTDYTVFYFVSGEAVAFIPTSSSDVEKVTVSVLDGKVYFRTYFDPSCLAVSDSRMNISSRMIYAGSEVVHRFSSAYYEEARPLTEENITVASGSFDGYDPYLGRYTFTCDDNGGLDITLCSKDDRYVYFGVKGSSGDVEMFNSVGEKLPLTLIGGDECVFGVYLESGEDMTFTLRSVNGTEAERSLLEGIGYRTSSGKDIKAVFTSAEYICCSGFYNEVKYTGLTEDGAAKVSLTVASFVDGSVPAVSYALDVSFIRNVSLVSLSENLKLLSFDIKDISDLYYSDVSGEVVQKKEKDASSDTVFTLSNLGPTAAASSSDGILMAGVVNSFSATANIVPLSSVLHVGRDGDTVFMSATGDLLNDDTATFGLGDHIRLKAVFTETSVGENGKDQISTFRDAYCNGYVAAVERGVLKSVSPVPVISVSSSVTAIFSIRGGMDTVPVKIEGFTSYSFPTVSVNGENFTPAEYGVYIDGNGTVGFVFSIPADSYVMVSASDS